MTRSITEPGKFSGRRLLLALASATLAAPGLIAAPARAQSRPLRIGFISPRTGPLAAFATADAFVLEGVQRALQGGLAAGGRRWEVQILARDSQSSPSRAADIAASLIASDSVDLMLAASTSDTTNPVADQCEVNGVPCITTDTPWQAHFFGRRGDPRRGFDWTYHFFWGLDEAIAAYSGMWDQLPTNRVVGTLWSNDPDGNAFGDQRTGLPAGLARRGYRVVNAGTFTPLSSDYSAQIAALKRGDAEILTGVFLPPDFTTFWTQAAQQGYRPKIATVAKALLFPSAVEAVGDRGNGLSTELWWSPGHPFRSTLTGQSAREFADAYTEATGRQWIQPMGFKHGLLEVACDVLRRASDPQNPASVRDAIAATDLRTIVGPVSFKGGPVRNVAVTPLVGGQWVQGSRFRYDCVTVSNGNASEIPVERPFQALRYPS